MSIRQNLAAQVGRMSNKIAKLPNHTAEEIDAIAHKMPIMAMKDPINFARFVEKENLSLADCATLIAWIDTMAVFLSDIKVTKEDVTIDTASTFLERARVNAIVIHRLNYILHENIINVIDILDRDKRLVFGIKKAASSTEKVWSDYTQGHRKQIERTAWYTMQDHLRLVNDAITPFTEKVYEAIRDNMIFLGMKDVEVRAYCAVTLFMGKVAYHSYNAFFSDFERECGINFSKCFADYQMAAMTKMFARLCDAIGFKTRLDANGCYEPKDYNPEDCDRFKTEWKRLIEALRDDDLMDENAQRAIALNPDVQEEYKHILEEEEAKVMKSEVDKLSSKFKVTKQ